jgi:hypothetical protein
METLIFLLLLGNLVGWIVFAYRSSRNMRLPKALDQLVRLCKRYVAAETKYALWLSEKAGPRKKEISGLPSMRLIDADSLAGASAVRAALWQARFRDAQLRFELATVSDLEESFRNADILYQQDSSRERFTERNLSHFELLEMAYEEENGIYLSLGALAQVCSYEEDVQRYLLLEVGSEYTELIRSLNNIYANAKKIEPARRRCRSYARWAKDFYA